MHRFIHVLLNIVNELNGLIQLSIFPESYYSVYVDLISMTQQSLKPSLFNKVLILDDYFPQHKKGIDIHIKTIWCL